VDTASSGSRCEDAFGRSAGRPGIGEALATQVLWAVSRGRDPFSAGAGMVIGPLIACRELAAWARPESKVLMGVQLSTFAN